MCSLLILQRWKHQHISHNSCRWWSCPWPSRKAEWLMQQWGSFSSAVCWRQFMDSAQRRLVGMINCPAFNIHCCWIVLDFAVSLSIWISQKIFQHVLSFYIFSPCLVWKISAFPTFVSSGLLLSSSMCIKKYRGWKHKQHMGRNVLFQCQTCCLLAPCCRPRKTEYVKVRTAE